MTGEMLAAYVTNAQRKLSKVGWYSFMMWEQILAPECLFSNFVDSAGLPTYNTSEKKRAQHELCYGRNHRVQADLSKWRPEETAHCWVFKETMIADLRECLHAYETSMPTVKGAVNWTAFEMFDKDKDKPGWFDKSKSLANADARHGSCTRCGARARAAHAGFYAALPPPPRCR